MPSHVREEPLLFKPGQFYVIASLFGVIEPTLFTTFFKAPAVPCALLAIAITFICRLFAIVFDWKTKSVIRLPEDS